MILNPYLFIVIKTLGFFTLIWGINKIVESVFRFEKHIDDETLKNIVKELSEVRETYEYKLSPVTETKTVEETEPTNTPELYRFVDKSEIGRRRDDSSSVS